MKFIRAVFISGTLLLLLNNHIIGTYGVKVVIPEGISAVNGSSTDMGCTGREQDGSHTLCDCSYLIDGVSPNIYTSSSDWASQLVTVRWREGNANINVPHVLLTFGFDTPVSVTGIVIDLFNCPDWNIGATHIQAYFSTQYDLSLDISSGSFAAPVPLSQTSCNSLSTVTISSLPGGSFRTIYIALAVGSSDWAHVGEVRFSGYDTGCKRLLTTSIAPSSSSMSFTSVLSTLPRPTTTPLSLFMITITTQQLSSMTTTSLHSVMISPSSASFPVSSHDLTSTARATSFALSSNSYFTYSPSVPASSIPTTVISTPSVMSTVSLTSTSTVSSSNKLQYSPHTSSIRHFITKSASSKIELLLTLHYTTTLVDDFHVTSTQSVPGSSAAHISQETTVTLSSVKISTMTTSTIRVPPSSRKFTSLPKFDSVSSSMILTSTVARRLEITSSTHVTSLSSSKVSLPTSSKESDLPSFTSKVALPASSEVSSLPSSTPGSTVIPIPAATVSSITSSSISASGFISKLTSEEDKAIPPTVILEVPKLPQQSAISVVMPVISLFILATVSVVMVITIGVFCRKRSRKDTNAIDAYVEIGPLAPTRMDVPEDQEVLGVHKVTENKEHEENNNNIIYEVAK